MPVSEAQKKASKKYFDNNYKQVKLSMPIKEAEMLEEYCKNLVFSQSRILYIKIRILSIEKIKNKLWELEGYKLQCEIKERNFAPA